MSKKWCGALDQKIGSADQFRLAIYLRALLIVSLILAAAICSVLSYLLLSNNELSRFTTQYNSISDSALNSVVDSFARTNIGLREMASTYSYNFPNASSWPEVAWPGFQNTAELLGRISALENMAFMPIVRPDQLASYEAFMKDYYLHDDSISLLGPLPGLELGQVWSLSDNYLPYHDITGYTTFSKYLLTTPAAQYTSSAILGPEYLTYNLHSTDYFAYVLDNVMECALNATNSDEVASCGAISESVTLPFANYTNLNPPVLDVQALIAHPIFPANNRTAMVGFMSGAMSWKALLIKAVPTFVNGLDCVITTGEQESFTYSIIDGAPVFRALGDNHDRSFDTYRRAKILDTQVAQVSSVTTYEIAFYPRREFLHAYTSFVPIISAVVLVLVFLFCSVVFFAYDVLMKREFGRNQAVLDTKRRFVRFISHEIRTPLNTVRLGLKVFELELSDLVSVLKKTPIEEMAALVLAAIENWRQLTDDISSNSESAVEVLDDLLNYDKIEMGNLRLEYSLFNMWEMSRRTIAMMQMQAKEKAIHLDLTCDNLIVSVSLHGPLRASVRNNVRSTCVVGDSLRMGQVLRNLVSNAIKFTPVGGYVSVTAKTIPDGMPDAVMSEQMASNKELNLHSLVRAGSILIAVKDSGAGLTPNQLDEICSEGVQFNANELQAGQGSGLGLFISKGIVEQHGGKLTVTSEGLGRGVTFAIELPLYEPAQVSCNPPHQVLNRGLTSNSSSTLPVGFELQKRTLVVDDSPFNRKMLIRLLTSKGYDCEQAEDGQCAIKLYQELRDRGEQIDAITMDFEMPVMNGPTATKKLRELGCTSLIVGVTGNVLPEDVTYFKAQGADHVLVKPLVVETFEEILYKHQMTRLRSMDNSNEQNSSTMRLSVKPTAMYSGSYQSIPQVLPLDERECTAQV